MEVQVQRWWCRGWCLQVVLRCIGGVGAEWVLRFSSGDYSVGDCAGQMQRREEQEMQRCRGEGEEVLRRC